MKRISYILLVIVFFNCAFLTMYYLKVFNKLELSNLLDMNIIVFLLTILALLIYTKLFISKFSFIFISILGLLIGLIISFIVKGLIVEEYLFIITFTSFSFTFLTYSIYFDNKNKEIVKDSYEV